MSTTTILSSKKPTICKKAGDDTKLIFTEQTLCGRLYIALGCLFIIFFIVAWLLLGVNYNETGYLLRFGLFFIFTSLSLLTVQIRFYPNHFEIVRGPYSWCSLCCNFRPTFGKIVVPYSQILAVRELPQSCIYFSPIHCESFTEVSGSSMCCKQNVVQITIVPQYYQASYIQEGIYCFFEEMVVCCFYRKPGKSLGEGGCCFCLLNTVYFTANSPLVSKLLLEKKRQYASASTSVSASNVVLQLVAGTENSIKETILIQ